MSPFPLRATVPAAVLLASVAFVAGCGQTGTGAAPASPPAAGAADFPLTVSNCGRDFTYDSPPSRVVVGYPTTLETLVALGVTDRVKGYLAADFAPLPEGVSGIEAISPQYNAPRESLLAAQPDLVLYGAADQATGEEGTANIDDLQVAGANAYILQGNCADAGSERSIEEVYTDVEQLGSIFGIPDRGTELATQLRNRVQAIAGLRGSREPVSVAFVQVYDGQLYALSGGTYDAVLGGAAATNEFAGVAASFAQISPEQVLTLDAGYVVVAYAKPDSPEQAVARVTELLANNSAVASGKVVAVSSDQLGAGGVSLVDVVEQIGQAVYG